MSQLQPVLIDKDVTLRPIEICDADLLLAMNNDDELARFTVGNPRKVTMSEQVQWIKDTHNEKNTVRYMIEYQNMTVGTVFLSSINTECQTGNINIKIMKDARGKGIGTRAVVLMLRYVFIELNLYCITAHVLIDNMASRGMFIGLGFKEEGVLRCRAIKNGCHIDLVSYSLLRTEFDS